MATGAAGAKEAARQRAARAASAAERERRLAAAVYIILERSGTPWYALHGEVGATQLWVPVRAAEMCVAAGAPRLARSGLASSSAPTLSLPHTDGSSTVAPSLMRLTWRAAQEGAFVFARRQAAAVASRV